MHAAAWNAWPRSVSAKMVTGSVFHVAGYTITVAPSSPIDKATANPAAAPRAGSSSGKVTRNSTRTGPAPRDSAACR